MKMRLNKYQKAWVDRLMSGKTKKCKKVLADGEGRNCCLGVAINVCKLEGINAPNKREISEDLDKFPKTMKALHINEDGSINFTKVSKEWLNKLDQEFNLVVGEIKEGNLVQFNDDTEMTHKDIGEFINDNREAVFGS